MAKGNLALVDTFAGMLPCRILGWTGEQLPPPPDRCTSRDGAVRVELTADRGAYKRGEVLEYGPGKVVLRERSTRGPYIRARCRGLDDRCARAAGHAEGCRPLTDVKV